MLSTCLSNDSTIVWTRRPFIRGLLGTIKLHVRSGDHVFRTAVAVNSKSLVLIVFMSVSEHAVLNYVNMLVIRKRFQTLYAISNLCTHLYIICIVFILTYVTGA
ncbi:hypothetical protein Hanom_Chr02g00110391 [Helianthus anomalus]